MAQFYFFIFFSLWIYDRSLRQPAAAEGSSKKMIFLNSDLRRLLLSTTDGHLVLEIDISAQQDPPRGGGNFARFSRF